MLTVMLRFPWWCFILLPEIVVLMQILELLELVLLLFDHLHLEPVLHLVDVNLLLVLSARVVLVRLLLTLISVSQLLVHQLVFGVLVEVGLGVGHCIICIVVLLVIVIRQRFRDVVDVSSIELVVDELLLLG